MNADANKLAGALQVPPRASPAGKGSVANFCSTLYHSRELVLQDQVEKSENGRYHNFNSEWPKAFVSNKWTSSFKLGN